MGIKLSLWCWAGQGLSNTLNPVRRAVFSIPCNQIQPGPLHKADLTHAQSEAEKVEQRKNYGLLEWAGLSLLNCTKRHTGAVNPHPDLAHQWTTPCACQLIDQIRCFSSFWMARAWSGSSLPSIGLDVEMLEEEPSSMNQNGEFRRAGLAIEFTRRASVLWRSHCFWHHCIAKGWRESWKRIVQRCL